MALEKFTFLDELGIQKLSEALLTKSNSRIAERIVQELSDASDADHIASAALLNSLIKTRDALIAANTTAAGTNKTAIDGVVSSIDTLTDDVTANKTAIDGVVSDITSLDERVDGLTHLTIDTVTGVIDDVADPQTDILYLQRDDESDTTWMLYIYREDGTWVQIGDTGVDLSGYWSKDDNDSIKETIGVPEMVPLKNEKILAAIDAAFENTDVITPKDPNLQYLTINDSGTVSASAELKALTADTLIDLVIPSEINGINTIGIKNGAFWDCKALKSVVISEGVTTIGSQAFQNCTSLTSITIPDSVTEIGASAFYGCGLTSITIPSGITTIGSNALQNCTSLTSVTIPDSVKTIGHKAFQGCKSLSSITLPSTLTTIELGLFYDCKALENISIPDSVTSIGADVFRGCTALSSITLSKNITELKSSVFMSCKALSSIVLPDTITSIGASSFYGCSSLSSIVIPDAVTSIGTYVFYDCTSLTSITIPENVTEIGENTFTGCTNLTSINVSKSPDSITGAPWGAPSATVKWKELRNVNVTFDSTQGSVTGTGSYLPGDTVELTTTPVGENVVCTWRYTINNVPHTSQSRTLTFTMPFEDVELALAFTNVSI